LIEEEEGEEEEEEHKNGYGDELVLETEMDEDIEADWCEEESDFGTKPVMGERIEEDYE